MPPSALHFPPPPRQVTLSAETHREWRVVVFFSFLVWPLLWVVGTAAALWARSRRRQGAGLSRLPLFCLLLPWHLLRSSRRRRQYRMFWGILLLLPFMAAFWLSPLAADWPFAADRGVLAAPGPGHPLGSDGQGEDLSLQIVLGARYTYLAGLLAVAVMLAAGVWLGGKTVEPGPRRIILAGMQWIEAVPVLLLLVIVLAVYGLWEERFGWQGHSFAMRLLRVGVVGLVLGAAFLPRLVRVLEERIRSFAQENFIRGTKAHGIPQPRILRFHILRRNCLGDIIVTCSQSWATVVLLEISLNYLIRLLPLLGARVYESWAGMLLTFEARRAIVHALAEGDFAHWWLYAWPAFFIVVTVAGLYLFGDGVKELEGGSAAAAPALADDLPARLEALHRVWRGEER